MYKYDGEVVIQGLDVASEPHSSVPTSLISGMMERISELEVAIAEKDKEIAELRKQVSNATWDKPTYGAGPGYL